MVCGRANVPAHDANYTQASLFVLMAALLSVTVGVKDTINIWCSSPSALHQRHAFSRRQLGQVRPKAPALPQMPFAAAAPAANDDMHALLSIRNINCPILCGAHVFVEA